MIGCLSHTLNQGPNLGPSPQPSACPEWASDQRPFSSQATTQSTQPHQPGLNVKIFTFAVQSSFRVTLMKICLCFKNVTCSRGCYLSNVHSKHNCRPGKENWGLPTCQPDRQFPVRPSHGDRAVCALF